MMAVLRVIGWFLGHPHSPVIPGYHHISYSSPIKPPLCSIAIPSSDKSSIPSATDCVLCFRLSLAPPL
ncbi:hypothetical protein HanPSC8_Chr06g0238081 [Helianthus annuus]|nr:hypothetical protein HanPSC8_Chr06g0238081 [Helianthus annuus]